VNATIRPKSNEAVQTATFGQPGTPPQPITTLILRKRWYFAGLIILMVLGVIVVIVNLLRYLLIEKGLGVAVYAIAFDGFLVWHLIRLLEEDDLQEQQLNANQATVSPSDSNPAPMNNETTNEQSNVRSHKSTALTVGTRAPDFTLKSTPDQTVSLNEFRGQPVVLAFYPADWSPVCGDQMSLYNEILPEFQELGAEILGISVDGVWCHTAFSRERKLHFPLLADFEPKGAVARLYGVYRDADGTTERALFVINSEGIIHWSYVSPVGVNPGADGILTALEELQKKKEVK